MTNEQKRLAHNKRIRDWVAINPEKRSAINRKYYQANKEYIMWARNNKDIK